MTEAAPLANIEARIDLAQAFVAHWRQSMVVITVITVSVAFGWQGGAPLPWRLAWCAMACLNYAWQAVLYRRIERAGRCAREIAAASTWVAVSVGFSGLLWGSVPWLLAPPTAQALHLACAFNLLLIFCAAMMPVSRSMSACAIGTMGVTTCLALAFRLGSAYEGLAFALGFLLIYAFSVRLGDAIFGVLRERRVADGLTLRLREQQAQLLESERQRAVLIERQRLMRDMHDVVGGGLAASLVAVEHGEAGPQELAGMLRDCLVDLRLIIDSIEPVDMPVTGMLAALRFRMSDRLAAAGVRLDWRMADVPALPWLGPSEALQLLRVVQELLTNAIKHAKARRIGVEADLQGDALLIRVSDDGEGFDMQRATSGRGQRFMVQRMMALGGRIDVDSVPGGGGTRTVLSLPLQR
jgi:signal transduction histidine kinase